MRLLFRSSFEDEMAIWVDGGGDDLALLTNTPSSCCDAPLFDIEERDLVEI
jgi:hypothetical protein